MIAAKLTASPRASEVDLSTIKTTMLSMATKIVRVYQPI
jgi:hypothetical protein